jgi:hypothetical protein
MTKFITLLFLALASFSCEDDISKLPVESLSGSYSGIFGKSHPQIKYKASDVTLTFDGDIFYGQGEFIDYPAICRGFFSISGDSILFVDSCAWTADRVWENILSGSFQLEQKGDEIIFKRQRGETTDRYVLIKDMNTSYN